MKDPRAVDERSIEQLQQALALKKREARLQAFRRTGRALPLADPNPLDADPNPSDQQSIDAGNAGTTPPARSRLRRAANRLLLVLEVGAVLGLGAILFQGMGVLDRLNREVAEAIALPTLAPTPLITVLVLPSGHTPPTVPGGAQPNESEIPSHLRPLLTSLPTLAAPTPGPQQALRLQLPAIGVDAPVVQGDGWEQLKQGVAQHPGTADPGMPGNAVLSGHNDIFGEIFRDLDQLRAGDEIFLHTAVRVYRYVITGWKVVGPTEVSVMAPTQHASLTLISCYPYRVDDKRIVVFADLQAG